MANVSGIMQMRLLDPLQILGINMYILYLDRWTLKKVITGNFGLEYDPALFTFILSYF